MNRTIEGLEARLESLLDNPGPMGRESRRHAVPNQTSPGRAAFADPVEEITRRQRNLRQGRSGRASDTARYEPVLAQQPEAGDIGTAIASLRSELGAQISSTIGQHVSTLRREIADIKSAVRDEPQANSMRNELAQLAKSIQQLEQNGATLEADALRGEFDQLKSMFDGLAGQDAMHDIKRSVDAFSENLASFDSDGLRRELLNLAYRLDDIRGAIGSPENNVSLDALEQRIQALAGAVDGNTQRSVAGDEELVRQFGVLDSRLDEISRAIAAASNKAPIGFDPDTLDRIEARISSISGQLDNVAQPDHTEHTEIIGSRIEALASRIEELANEEAHTQLTQRLDRVASMLEGYAPGNESPEITNRLRDISLKLDAMDQAPGDHNDQYTNLTARLDHVAQMLEDRDPDPQSSDVADRLNALSDKIDALDQRPIAVEGRSADLEERISYVASMLETQNQQPVANPDISDRLDAIAARLDQTTGSPSDDSALRALEAQIGHLTNLINNPGSETGEVGELGARLGAIEEHIATNDEYIIEAARQAAEAVVQSYAGHTPSSGQANDPDLAAVSALAEDLRALEQASRASDERHSKSFEAVHDTLVRIAERLETIGSSDATPSHIQQAPAPVAKEPMEQGLPIVPGQAHVEEKLSPMEAAASAAAAASEEVIADEPSEVAPEKASFLSGLANRLKPSRTSGNKEPSFGDDDEHRAALDDTPSIDPAGNIDAMDANLPLEPGSGEPDISRIMERVRAAQNDDEMSDEGSGQNTNFIAAARRAAQAAAAEVETVDRKKRSGKSAGIGARLKEQRRPILMAAGAVLLVLMSWPLVSNLVGGSAEQEVAVIEDTGPVTIEAPLVEDQLAAAPEVIETTPASTDLELPEVRIVEPEDVTSSAVTIEDTPTIVAASNPVVGEPEMSVGLPAETEYAALVDALPEAIAPAPILLAAESGDPLALFEIGARFTEGRGTEVDLSTASTWYTKSAELGFAPAQYRLANLFEKGTGVERNIAKAKTWYQMAAEQGNASAMHNLAVLHAMGGGGAPDFDSAGRWFKSAADLGVRDSQFNLGILYVQGNGVERDLEESYKWFAIAGSEGDRDALTKRDQVAETMRPEQIESARAKVDLWKPKPLSAAANSVELPPEWANAKTQTASVDMTKAVRNIQAILNNNGFDAGVPDGIMGKKTVNAIKQFQTSIGMEPTGEVSDDLVRELLARNG